MIGRTGPLWVGSTRFDPRYGPTGRPWCGVGTGGPPVLVSRRRGVSGFRGVAPGTPEGKVNPDFEAGRPGTYLVRMRAVAVPFDAPVANLFDPAPFTRELRSRGIDATVTQVRYVGNENARSTNWAADVLDGMVSSGTIPERGVADRVFEFTVVISGGSSLSGMSGLGAVPGVVVGIAILAGIAVVLALLNHVAGIDVITETVTKLLSSIGSGAGDALKESAFPLLAFGAAAALAVFLLKRSGARVSTSKFSF